MAPVIGPIALSEFLPFWFLFLLPCLDLLAEFASLFPLDGILAYYGRLAAYGFALPLLFLRFDP